MDSAFSASTSAPSRAPAECRSQIARHLRLLNRAGRDLRCECELVEARAACFAAWPRVVSFPRDRTQTGRVSGLLRRADRVDEVGASSCPRDWELAALP